MLSQRPQNVPVRTEDLFSFFFFFFWQLTYADLAWMHNITWANTIQINPKLENFPKLKALREKVCKLPRIAAWNEKWKHLPF